MPLDISTVAQSPMPLYEPSSSLRVLAVGESADVRGVLSVLAKASHSAVQARDLAEATEVLILRSFDVILISPRIFTSEVDEFAAAVRQLDKQRPTQSRTTVLLLEDRDGATESAAEAAFRKGTIDGVLEDSLDPDALTLAIARLASAVSVDKAAVAVALAPELPVLDVEQLKEQVAFDDELLAELIDLYISERAKQSLQMKDACVSGDYGMLSRVAHTIKGSLASLHAAAARAVAQSLESAASESCAAECPDLLAVLEGELDRLDEELLALRRRLA